MDDPVKTTVADFFIINVGRGKEVIICALNHVSQPELTWTCPTHSSDAVIVYKDVSENGCLGSRIAPPPSYEDLEF